MIRIILLSLFLFACSSGDSKKDPLKPVKKGHVSLYKNGAFKIPYTTIKLIPPGPSTTKLAGELLGVKAYGSLKLALTNVKSSYYLAKKIAGTSYKAADKTFDTSKDLSKKMLSSSIDDSIFLFKKSVTLPKDMVKSTWNFSNSLVKEMAKVAKEVRIESSKGGEEMREEVLLGGKLFASDLAKAGANASGKTGIVVKKLSQSMTRGGREFDKTMSKSAGNILKGMGKAAKKTDDTIDGLGASAQKGLSKGGDSTDKAFSAAGEEADEMIGGAGNAMGKGISNLGSMANTKSEGTSKELLRFAKNKFIQGYTVSLGKNVKKRVKRLSEQGLKRFKDAATPTLKVKQNVQDKLLYVLKNTHSDVASDFSNSWEEAGKEVTESATTLGYSLGLIKAFAWAVKSVTWDALIKPLGKYAGAGLGYIAVEGIAIPVLIFSEATALTFFAGEVIYNVAATAYDIVAPTAIASVATVFSAINYTGGKVTAGTLKMASLPVEYGMRLVGKTAKYTFKTTGKVGKYALKASGIPIRVATYTSGKVARGGIYATAPVVAGGTWTLGKLGKATSYIAAGTNTAVSRVATTALNVGAITTSQGIKGASYLTGGAVELVSKTAGHLASGAIYLGIPAAWSGINVAGATAGVAVGGISAGAGTAYSAIGTTASAATFGFGTVLSSSLVAGGTAVAAGAGTAAAAYEVAKSITVPSAYTLGSGIVLTYGSLVHLGAHTVLAAADLSYLVLSMEGPRWVIYGVKGVLGKGEDLPGGTVLNLEKMKKKGERFEYIPASEDEIKKVIKSVAQ